MKLAYEPRNQTGRWHGWSLHRIRRTIVVLGAILLTIVLAASLVLFLPGLFYRHRDEVDIHSGRIRRTSHILFIRVRHAVEESPLSAVLASADQAGREPDWKTVNTFEGTRRVSPHYLYHSAISQMRRLEQLWAMVPFTPEANAEVAMNVLRLWQTAGHDGDAGQYIYAVENAALNADRSAHPIAIQHLPTPK